MMKRKFKGFNENITVNERSKNKVFTVYNVNKIISENNIISPKMYIRYNIILIAVYFYKLTYSHESVSFFFKFRDYYSK